MANNVTHATVMTMTLKQNLIYMVYDKFVFFKGSCLASFMEDYGGLQKSQKRWGRLNHCWLMGSLTNTLRKKPSKRLSMGGLV